MNIGKLFVNSPSFGVNCSNYIEREITRARTYYLHNPNDSVAKDVYTIRNIYPDRFISVVNHYQTQKYAEMSLYITEPKNEKEPKRISNFRWYFSEPYSVSNIHEIAKALIKYQRNESK